MVQGGLECREAEGRETEVQNCQELVTLWVRSLTNVEDTSFIPSTSGSGITICLNREEE